MPLQLHRGNLLPCVPSTTLSADIPARDVSSVPDLQSITLLSIATAQSLSCPQEPSFGAD